MNFIFFKLIILLFLVLGVLPHKAYSKDTKATQELKISKHEIEELKHQVQARTLLNNSYQSQTTTNFITQLSTMLKPQCDDLSYITDIIAERAWLFLAFQKNFEKLLLSCKTNPAALIKIFYSYDPISPEAKLLLLQAKLLTGRTNNPAAELNKFKSQWLTANLSLTKELELSQLYTLAPKDIEQRISYLLWHNQLEVAKLWIKKLTINRTFWERELQVALTGKIAKPQNDFEKYIQFKALRKAEASRLIQALLAYQPKSYQEIWWKNIAQFAVREAIRLKQYRNAYQLTQKYSPHLTLATGQNETVEAYWLGGFIAYQFLHNYKVAYKHFNSMYTTAKLANSKSQAAYWSALAAKAQNNNKDYKLWLQKAKSYKGYFYGYAAEILDNTRKDISYDSLLLTSDKEAHTSRTDVESQKNIKNIEEALKASSLLYQAGYVAQADVLIDYLTHHIIQQECYSKEIINKILMYFYNQNHPHLAVKLSRKIANHQGCINYIGYPSLKLEAEYKQNKALYLAIMRQESSFDPMAISSAGAFGLMQLIPDTAKRMAKKLSLEANSYKTNTKANIAKGICYLDWLSTQFSSLVLVIAAYNAGEGNAQKWQVYYNFSDNSLQDIITFIELIPYNETRLYTKKVLENFWTYDLIFCKKKNKIDLIQDLKIS